MNKCCPKCNSTESARWIRGLCRKCYRKLPHIYEVEKIANNLYRLNNKVKILRDKKSTYRANLSKERNSRNSYCKQRIKNDVAYRIKQNIKNRVRRFLKDLPRNSSISDSLGCSAVELKEYLESKWQPGMTWENYGQFGWHVDHIKPLSRFDLSNKEELKTACHYTNLQSLWWQENLSKSNR